MGDFVNFAERKSPLPADPMESRFASTWNLPLKMTGELSWMESSFPVLCTILDKVTPLFSKDPDTPADSESAAKAINLLKDLFPPLKTIPLYDEKEKFKNGTPDVLSPVYDANAKKGICSELSVDVDQVEGPRIGNLEFHHHRSNGSYDGLLQSCCGNFYKVYSTVDTRVREMDKLIQNPETNICRDAMESSVELELPGPYSFSQEVKAVSFSSNRHGMDVLGLIVLLIDTIYASSCVSVVDYNGRNLPLEFTQDIVKVVAIIKATFPENFYELQKLTMYSVVFSVLKKLPFKWNRCMLHVLEDLIVHPLDYVDEKTVEFRLLQVVVRKRAKVLFKMFSPDASSNIFDSVKHRSLFREHFSAFYKEEVTTFLKTSASNCLRGHRVKNIRYKVKDNSFESFLKDIYASYC